MVTLATLCARDQLPLFVVAIATARHTHVLLQDEIVPGVTDDDGGVMVVV